LAAVGGHLQTLASAQDRTEQALTRLTDRVDQLTERVDKLAKDMHELARAQAATDRKLADLVDVVKGMNDRLGRLDGESFERRCREKGHGRFGRVARRLQLVDFDTLSELLDDAETAGLLRPDEVDAVMATDAVFRGRLRPDGQPAHLLIEASVTLGHDDVRRARERADLLARAVDTTVVPVVAGEYAPSPVSVAAQDAEVWQVLPGKVIRPTDELDSF
jgi:hypothetical protein